MKHIFLILLLTSLSPALQVKDKIYDVVDKQAEFKGGNGALMSFMYKNMKYPDSLVRSSTSYRSFYLKLIIEKEGAVICESCNAGVEPICIEARKMVAKMPKWKPAEYKGKKVRCRYSLPIRIALE